MTNVLKNNKWLLIIFAVFILTRFLGLGQIYHQDEYRWASIANPAFGDLQSPHPPLPEISYKFIGFLLGYDYLRVVPIIFSFLNLVLIYLILKKTTGKSLIGLIGAGLFTINIYSTIAGLQVDIDGAILPFFILLGYYAHLYLLENQKSKKCWILFVVALIGGFLTKLSFILFLATLIVYFVIINLIRSGKKISWKKFLYFLAVIAVLAGLSFILFETSFQIVLKYAASFNSLNFESRHYFDFIFKIFKSFVWLSPLLTVPLTISLFNKKNYSKYGFWYLFLLINAIFYGVAFDFTTKTVERYFMFLILPAIMIVSNILYDFWAEVKKFKYFSLSWILVLFVVFSFIVLTAPHDVLPLNPKMAYLTHAESLDFNFLIPFSGGSGPSGFYFSAQFILWSWIVSMFSLLSYQVTKKYKQVSLAVFIVFGVGYNLLFLNEYLGKSIYGNVPKLSEETINYVLKNKEIKNVITYYDIGAYHLSLDGKYFSRFYTAPSRDYTKKLTEYRGHYMIVDFPAIDKKSEYWRLISRCNLDKKFTYKKVDSYVFDCRFLVSAHKTE